MPKQRQGATTGAQRKREHDDRKRNAGLKEYRAWVTDEERAMLRDALANYRSKRGE